MEVVGVVNGWATAGRRGLTPCPWFHPPSRAIIPAPGVVPGWMDGRLLFLHRLHSSINHFVDYPTSRQCYYRPKSPIPCLWCTDARRHCELQCCIRQSTCISYVFLWRPLLLSLLFVDVKLFRVPAVSPQFPQPPFSPRITNAAAWKTPLQVCSAAAPGQKPSKFPTNQLLNIQMHSDASRADWLDEKMRESFDRTPSCSQSSPHTTAPQRRVAVAATSSCRGKCNCPSTCCCRNSHCLWSFDSRDLLPYPLVVIEGGGGGDGVGDLPKHVVLAFLWKGRISIPSDTSHWQPRINSHTARQRCYIALWNLMKGRLKHSTPRARNCFPTGETGTEETFWYQWRVAGHGPYKRNIFLLPSAIGDLMEWVKSVHYWTVY